MFQFNLLIIVYSFSARKIKRQNLEENVIDEKSFRYYPKNKEKLVPSKSDNFRKHAWKNARERCKTGH